MARSGGVPGEQRAGHVLGLKGLALCTETGTIATFEIVLVIAAVAAVAVLGAYPVRLELRRHAVVVAADGAVLVVLLFELRPAVAVAVMTAGVALAHLVRRDPVTRAVLGVSVRTVAAGVALAGVTMLHADDRNEPVDLAIAAAVVIVAFVAESVATGALAALREQAPLGRVLARTWIPTVLLHVGTIPLGVAALVLADRSALLPVLLAPVVLAVVISGRALGDRQAERLRVERLLQASTKTAE